MRINRSRHFDIYRPEQALSDVTIIGAGGIGSPTALLLAKMGVPKLTIYDFDSVEDVNPSTQFYRRKDIGKPKVVALAEEIDEHAGETIEIRRERYNDQRLSGLVISAVDTMSAREDIWKNGVKRNPLVPLYIDGRLGGLLFEIHTAQPCDDKEIERYQATFSPLIGFANEPCTNSAISYTTFGIASMICGIVRNWWVDGIVPPKLQGDYASLTFI
jgi:hypothetical protein